MASAVKRCRDLARMEGFDDELRASDTLRGVIVRHGSGDKDHGQVRIGGAGMARDLKSVRAGAEVYIRHQGR